VGRLLVFTLKLTKLNDKATMCIQLYLAT